MNGNYFGCLQTSRNIPVEKDKLHIVENIPVEKDKLHIVARCLDIWPWTRCKILVGILLGPQDLLMLRDNITFQISFWFVAVIMKEPLFFCWQKVFEGFVWKLNFWLTSLSNWCEKVIESTCNWDWVVGAVFVISDYGWCAIVFMFHTLEI